jgi:arylsulfate sulfotransferase
MLGNQVRKVTSTQLGTVAVHHECYEMPNGNLLTLGHELRMIGGYPGDETYNVVGDEILEFTWDGTVINRISLFDVLDPYRVLPGFDAPIQDDLFGVPTKDWTHANAVIYDESDDTYIVSVRHQDIVAKIDRAGQLVWVIGEDVAETAGDDAWPFVQLVGPGSYPNHQHAPELTPLGTILMYDNANSTHMSRPVEFLVDEMNLTMTQEWEWFDPEQDPPVYAHFIGDADYQPGGTVLVDHAGQDVDPLVEDTSTTFTHMVEVDHATDEKVWEVVIRDYSDPPARTSGYRAERLPSLYP